MQLSLIIHTALISSAFIFSNSYIGMAQPSSQTETTTCPAEIQASVKKNLLVIYFSEGFQLKPSPYGTAVLFAQDNKTLYAFSVGHVLTSNIPSTNVYANFPNSNNNPLEFRRLDNSPKSDDIAIIQLESKTPLTTDFLPLGESKQLQLGKDIVYVAGWPKFQDGNEAKVKFFCKIGKFNGYANLSPVMQIKYDGVWTSGGGSGGAVVNKNGSLVGIHQRDGGGIAIESFLKKAEEIPAVKQALENLGTGRSNFANNSNNSSTTSSISAPSLDNSSTNNSTPTPNPDNSSTTSSNPTPNPDNSSTTSSNPTPNPDNSSTTSSNPTPNPDNSSTNNSTPTPNPNNSSTGKKNPPITNPCLASGRSGRCW
jgi:hypothetical protein